MPDPNPNPTPEQKPVDKGAVTVTAADAKTYLADFYEPDTFKDLPDDKVLEMHKKVSSAVTKYTPKVEPPKAPEKYEFKLSDGVELDPAATKTFEPILKKHGISQEAAQDLATAWVAELSRQDGVINELFTGQMSSWETAAKQDKEFGGTNFDSNLKIAQRGIARFASPALKTLLDDTGLGNHPEMIRHFLGLGRTVKEDTHVTGNGTATTEQAVAAKLFDHPTSQVFK